MRRDRFNRHAIFLFAVFISALLAVIALAGCGKGKSKFWGDQSQQGGDGETRVEGFAGFAYIRGTQIYLADVERKEVRRLTTSDGGFSCLAFSPRGDKLAAIMVVGDANPQLVVVDVESGEVTDVSWTNEEYSGAWNEAGVRPWFGTMAWEDEDTLYANAVSEKLSVLYSHVVRVDLSAPSVEVVADDAANPALSPDGEELAYVRQPEDWVPVGTDSMWLSSDPGDLVVRDLESGDEREVRVTVNGSYRGYVFAAAFSPDGDHLAVFCSDEPDTILYYTNLRGEALFTMSSIGPAGKYWQPTFSPDGQWLAYHSTWMEDLEGNYTYSLHIIPTGKATPDAPVFEGLREPAWSPVPHGGLEREDLEELLGGQAEGGGSDEKAEIEAAMIAFVKANSSPGLEFRIENLVVRGNEAAGVCICTNERLDPVLVIMRKGPHGWEGVDFGTGIEPPSWYSY